MEKLGAESLTSGTSTVSHITNRTDTYKNRFIKSATVSCIGIMWLMCGTSCDRMEVTPSEEVHDINVMAEDSTKIEDKSGISFVLDSDSLEDEIENVYFNASEWEEEKMNADL